VASPLPRVTRTTGGRWRWSFGRISIAIGTSAITRARSAASSPLVASGPTPTKAGPLSPFRPSAPATNDPNRLGLQFCQPSEVRSHEDLHRPLSNTCPLPCGNHGRGGRRRQRLPLRLSMRRIRPTGGRASIRSIPLMSALVAEGADVDPWRLVLDGGAASALPVPGLFSQAMPCAGYTATRSEDLVDSLRIMIDAIGADGAPTDHPSGDGPLVCNVAGASRRHRDVRVEPHVNRSSKRGHVCARRHLTPDSLPPERCGTWAAARPPQPQKSGPSCRFAAARTTPVFSVSLRFASVRAPLIRPPRRCASGG